MVKEFEKQIAAFFGAPYAVAVDSCTHGIELCLRLKKVQGISVPRRTYLSVPMLANKLGIYLWWSNGVWQDYYAVHGDIYDAAVFWQKDGYIGGFMCLSFQYQKHLSLGRGGVILCPDLEAYNELKRMSYDGRLPDIPWREQNVSTFGFHYYMTPETAALGIEKLPKAIETPPRIWTTEDWPDVSKMEVFK